MHEKRMEVPIVDTHLHLWDLSRLRLDWLQDETRLNQSYLLSSYQESIANQHVSQALYMEVDVASELRQIEIEDITRYCRDPDILIQGIIMAADPGSADFLPFVDAQISNPYIKGVRRVLQTKATPPGYCLTQIFIKNLQELGSRGLPFHLCMRPAELLDACQLIRSCPGTKFVLDHCGNGDPYIVAGISDPYCRNEIFRHKREGWLHAMQHLAQLPNVLCKVSGVLAKLQPGWSEDIFAPMLNICFDLFGEDRVIFGGNWPVCNLGGTLEQWIQAVRHIISSRSESFQHKLLHQNARQFYQLK